MPTNDDTAFPSFSRFIESVASAGHSDYAARESARVGEPTEFEAMKAHVLSLYEGVDVQHSFVDANGQVFDCVPIEQQPSLKGDASGLVAAPDAPSGPTEDDRSADLAADLQLHPGRKDRFGHTMSCPPGTIAMRRVTLDELTQKGSLENFFRKAPGGTGLHPRLGPRAIAPYVHKWAHGYQNVDNVGGHSTMNLWAPAVGSQVFSLSQHWYAGGSPVQTLEIGWQVYPGKYNTTNPALFIYWTADGYHNTGNYNLDKAAFVQTNRNWILGGAVGPNSVYGGAQYTLTMAAYLSGGKWWLYVGGTAGSNAIGYYPASQYGTGPMATHASSVDYGGEVVDVTAWPPMGSGAFANAGWQHAAYQRDIGYYPTAGGAAQAALTPSQQSANCFTIQIASAAAPWNEYFFFGGPGGTGCT